MLPNLGSRLEGMERTEVKVHPNLHTPELMELRINNTMTTMESFPDPVGVLHVLSSRDDLLSTSQRRMLPGVKLWVGYFQILDILFENKVKYKTTQIAK